MFTGVMINSVHSLSGKGEGKVLRCHGKAVIKTTVKKTHYLWCIKTLLGKQHHSSFSR